MLGLCVAFHVCGVFLVAIANEKFHTKSQEAEMD